MGLNKLFKTQKKLDEKIITEKGLQGQDLLDKKILALQVELGELANEWRGFKFWKEDNAPRTFEPNPDDICDKCNGDPTIRKDDRIVDFCDYCDGCGVHFHNPLLEEYVDCLHFILSIGNDIGATYKIDQIRGYEKWNITQLFNAVYYQLAMFENDANNNSLRKNQVNGYGLVFNVFLSIGKRLGFTWDEIEQAYYEKNKINHERQESGY